MINKELKNKAEETEILTADDEKLHQMLGGLKKVNAPKNFDFQLKARIANKLQTLRQPFFTPFLRYALPLSVIILLAGFVFFNLSLSTGNQDAPVMTDNFQPIQNQTAPPDTIVAPSIEESLTASTNTNVNSEEKRNVPEIVNVPKKPAQDKPKYIAVKNPSRNRTEKVENDSRNNGGGGSRDITSRDAPPLFERNNNANSTNTKSPSISQHKLSLREVLLGIGIEADYSEKSWKIVSVEENSPAMRAGLQVGDLIEAIDGKKLASDTAFLKNFSGRNFQILRDGKQMIIDLTAK